MTWAAQILLAAFFAFVGFMKMTAPMAELERHHAWVAGLIPPVARVVGTSEMLCALLLVVPGLLRGHDRWIGGAAAALIANQCAAILFHALRGDLAGAITQNLVLIALLGLVATVRLRG
ncbi:DoxX family protein [Sphingomonas zeicaulis]|uniref:DoxX family protein n=1 Tax=Sphingomonas zeicaulis TaxID=1632740 RepID=UPI003D23740E